MVTKPAATQMGPATRACWPKQGILAYCHVKVPFGVVEAINGNIRAVLRRGRGYRDRAYLLLKVQRATAGSRRLRAA